MPSVTVAQRHKANQDPITDAHIILLDFQEEGNSTIHRAAINNEDVVHQSNTYIGTSIEIEFPGSGSKRPTVSLKMSNLSRIIGRAVNRAENLINCRLKVIDITDPDVAIMDSYNMFVMRYISGDSVQITAELGPRGGLNEPVPFRRTSRVYFPGVWFSK